MKKHLLKLLLLCCVGMLAISLFACVPSTEQYKLDFMVDGEVYHSRTTNGYSRVNPPADPSKEGFIFCGWYFDENVWSEEYLAYSLEKDPINKDTAVYAKWEIDESHTCKAGSWIVDIKATCKQEGRQYKVCTICKKQMDSEIIPITSEHAASYVVKEDVVNATCVATGSYTEVKCCSLCNKTLSKKKCTISIDKNAHDYSDGQLILAENSVNFAAECSLCTSRVYVADAKVDTVEVKKATCTTAGIKHYTYSAYGNTYVSANVEIPALGHMLCGVTIIDNKVYSEIDNNEIVELCVPYVNDANCGETIDALFKCENCSVFCDIEIAKPHSGKWSQVEAPNCHKQGKELLDTCSACDATDVVRAVAPTGKHVEDGYAVRKNGNLFDLVVPCVNASYGCDYAVVILKDIDVTTEEIISKDCSVPDIIRYTYSSGDITAKLDVVTCSGHFLDGVRSSTLQSPEGWFDYRYVKSLDEEGGIKLFADRVLLCDEKVSGYYVCESCNGMEDVRVYRPHSGSWETTKVPTCTVEGERSFHCDFCEYGDDGTVTEVVPVVDHEYNWELKIAESSNSVFAPFVLYGKCACGAEDRIDNVLVTTRISKTATCSENGELLYIYVHEGVEYSTKRELPKVAHLLNGESMNAGSKLDYAEYADFVKLHPGETLVCGEEAEGYYECSACGANVDIIITRTHSGQWEAVKDSDSTACVEKGVKTFACIYEGCGYTESKNYRIENHKLTAIYTADGSVQKLETSCTVEGCGYEKTYNNITDVKVKVLVTATCRIEGVIEYTFVDLGESVTVVANVLKGNHYINGVDYTTLLDENGEIAKDTQGLMITGNGNGAFKCDICEHLVSVKVKED